VSDLHLTDASVEALRDDLSSVADDLTTARRRLSGQDAEAVGAPRLVARVRDFADDWDHGIGRLAEQSGDAVTDLDTIRRTFDLVDQQLAEGLS